MSQPGYLRLLASRCIQIADEVSDGDDFVAIGRLAERFNARLLFRPLLVEGMLASSEQVQNGGDGAVSHQWCLLVDRETHDVSDKELACERFGSPLSARLRNTVAHELAHSLAFRPSEFRAKSPSRSTPEGTKREFVRSIEREAEKLSPLLLLSDALLARVFPPEETRVPVQSLCSAIRSAGVSRYVFVNRLNLLDLVDPKRLRSRPSLTNLAVGIGEWASGSEPSFKGWPFYSHFEGGKVPGFVFQLQRGVPLAAKNVFADSTFVFSGGSAEATECIVPAGTPRNPGMIKLLIRCSIEVGPRKAGSEFLFLIQSLKVAD